MKCKAHALTVRPPASTNFGFQPLEEQGPLSFSVAEPDSEPQHLRDDPIRHLVVEPQAEARRSMPAVEDCRPVDLLRRRVNCDASATGGKLSWARPIGAAQLYRITNPSPRLGVSA